jgi:transporter family-2 protein
VNILAYLFALAGGAASPVQAGTNAELNKALSSPVWAIFIVYCVGLAGILIMQVIARQSWPSQSIHLVPWWAWTGGLISIVSTIAGLTLAHKMGSGLYTGMTLTASLITSVVLDQFGLIGFKVHPITGLRGFGVGFLIAGIWMIARS